MDASPVLATNGTAARAEPAAEVGPEWWRTMRVAVIAGVLTGTIVVGLGSRLAMMALRASSSDRVIGRDSDDGFTIGRFTLGGTYNLVLLGGVVGLIGAPLYLMVRGSLIGPRWFRVLTVGLACGAVVGAMLLHADGIDFRVLTPTWFAIALFIALPFLFGVAISCTVEALDRRPVPTGPRRYLVPIGCMLIVPPAAIVLPFVAIAVGLVVVVRLIVRERDEPVPVVATFLLRAAWLSIAVMGLLALIDDVQAIRDVT